MQQNDVSIQTFPILATVTAINSNKFNQLSFRTEERVLNMHLLTIS